MSSQGSARLLELLSLLQSRRERTGPELAERLGVTDRTVRRDIQRLRELGYPVDAAPGLAGGYQLGIGSRLPPLLLDDAEAVAVAVGLRTGAAGALPAVEEVSARALAKIEQVLPSHVRRRVDAISTQTDSVARIEPEIDAQCLTVAAGCCRDAERMRFGYRDHGGALTRRHVEPNRIVHAFGRWYLLAWDTDRVDWRVFRLDRMSEPRGTGSRGPRRAPPEDPADYVLRSITTSAHAITARVRLEMPADEAVELLSPVYGVITPIDEKSCRFAAGGSDLASVAVGLLYIGRDFTVEDPPELAGHLRALRGRIDRAIPDP
ncbi:helix-turn-helix transcriptional regulator [Nocardiopsis coralliicola]